ncbi:MAG: inositol monophosphatase family protein [Novosphingobium sp.]|uniref:inositol monophosphatase family protein n=1 Tax=Novosphingobium sp. TaxID=1874826 RepID=UPI0032BEBF9E
MAYDAELALANRLADAARAVIQPLFRTGTPGERKADRTPVTEADRGAEQAMRALIEAAFPNDAIHGEEFGATTGTSGRTWVLDPIDGTTAFMAGRPIFGTLIALVQEGWPVMGLIDQAILGERWIGITGKPTTFNGVPVRTRPCPNLAEAALATTGPHYFDDHQGQHFMALAAKTDHKRMVMGGDCYNYAMLASGHLDLVCEANLKLHDYAALIPVVEGAGGVMCDWNGDPLHAASDGNVLALGDPARVEDVVAALACNH